MQLSTREQRNSLPSPFHASTKFTFTVHPFASPPSVASLFTKDIALSLKKMSSLFTEDIGCDYLNELELKKDHPPSTMYTNFATAKAKPPAIVGLPAIKSFNMKYKMLNRQNSDSVDSAATTDYLKHLSKISRSPQTMGVVKFRGIYNELNLE